MRAKNLFHLSSFTFYVVVDVDVLVNSTVLILVRTETAGAASMDAEPKNRVIHSGKSMEKTMIYQ